MVASRLAIGTNIKVNTRGTLVASAPKWRASADITSYASVHKSFLHGLVALNRAFDAAGGAHGGAAPARSVRARGPSADGCQKRRVGNGTRVRKGV